MMVTAMWPSVLLLAGTYCVERLAMLIMDACEGVTSRFDDQHTALVVIPG
jgi:hypothetical protein